MKLPSGCVSTHTHDTQIIHKHKQAARFLLHTYKYSLTLSFSGPEYFVLDLTFRKGMTWGAGGRGRWHQHWRWHLATGKWAYLGVTSRLPSSLSQVSAEGNLTSEALIWDHTRSRITAWLPKHLRRFSREISWYPLPSLIFPVIEKTVLLLIACLSPKETTLIDPFLTWLGELLKGQTMCIHLDIPSIWPSAQDAVKASWIINK